MRCVACDRLCEPWDMKPPKQDGSPEDLCGYCSYVVDVCQLETVEMPRYRQHEGAKEGLTLPYKTE